MFDERYDSGASQVISVILMVAVTLALVALATVVAFDIGDQTPSTADISLDTSVTSNGVQATVLTNGNADSVIIKGPNERSEEFQAEAGSTTTVGDGSGTYTVKAVLPDGSEQVVETVDITSDSVASGARTQTGEVTGTVEVNPKIPGAEIKSVEDGIVIDRAITDGGGEYQIGASEEAKIVVSTTDDVQLNGNDFYAGYSKPVQNVDQPVDFDFKNGQSVTVDGETVQVSHNLTDSNEKQIVNVHQLQAIGVNLSASYKLVDDIDAGETDSWNGGNGFDPIGEDSNRFNGSLNGNNHEIQGLTIDVSSGDSAAMIGYANNTKITDITLSDTSVNSSVDSNALLVGKSGSSSEYKNINLYGNIQTSANRESGMLIGEIDHFDKPKVLIEDVSASGTISGDKQIGGIVGRAFSAPKNSEGRIEVIDSSADISIDGNDRVGGLIGNSYNVYIKNSSATGVIDVGQGSYDNNAGGLVGKSSGNTPIVGSNSSVDINAADSKSVGGLVGLHNSNGVIKDSYSTGDVTGGENVGGLIGKDSSFEAVIKRSYSTSTVNGATKVGGLIGVANGASIENSYSVANISGASAVGGLVGDHKGGDILNSYITGSIAGSSGSGVVFGTASNGPSAEVRNVYWNPITTSEEDKFGANSRGMDITNVNSLNISNMTRSTASSTMSSLDFSSVWDTSSKYPTLTSIGQQSQVQNLPDVSKTRLHIKQADRVFSGESLTIPFEIYSPESENTEANLFVDGSQEASINLDVTSGQTTDASFTYTTQNDIGGSRNYKVSVPETSDQYDQTIYKELISSSDRKNLLRDVPVVEKLSYGSQLSATLSSSDSTGFTGKYDAYTFDAVSKDTVTITMSRLGADTKLLLLGPEGSKVKENDDASSGSDLPSYVNSRIKDYNIQQDGEYIIIATSYESSARFAYDLELENTG